MSGNDKIVNNSSESGDEVATPNNHSDDDTICSCDSANVRNDEAVSDERGKTENSYRIPIIGYEVMEERAKFTVFKLRVEKEINDDCWFVFRRYTDFVRLHSKLKIDHPDIDLPLPKKKWFGDNFNPNFLDERIVRLQDLINALTQHKILLEDPCVRDFFCLDEPPSITDNVEESKAVVEALEERIFHLQRQLKEKETAYERLKAAHSVEISAKLRLAGFIQECTRECPSCSAKLSQLGQIVK